jgi:hypothetical protein
MTKNSAKRMLNIPETSEYMGLRPQTVRNKLTAGIFPVPAKKIFSKILFDKKDIDRFSTMLKRRFSEKCLNIILLICWDFNYSQHGSW